MNKQYVKCLQDYMYMTKGKVYEVLEFHKYDPDYIIVEDDTGEPVEWTLAKGEFEFCDPPQQSTPEKSGITYKGQFYPCPCLSEMYALLDALHTIEEITQNGAK